MSLRTRTPKSVVSESNAPNFDNLSRVLEVGMTNKLAMSVRSSAEAHKDNMTMDEFASRFMKAVETETIDMNHADAIGYRATATRILRNTTSAAGEAKVMTKRALEDILVEVKQRWQGAKNPVHWSTFSGKKLSRLIKDHYKRRFSEKAWKEILMGTNLNRVYYADSGGNLSVQIYIDAPDKNNAEAKPKLVVQLLVFELEFSTQPESKVVYDLNEMQSMPYSFIISLIDRSIDVVVYRFVSWSDPQKIKMRQQESWDRTQ